MSTNTTNFNLIKPEMTDPADITAFNSNWDNVDNHLAISRKPFTANSTNGLDYIVTAPGVTELYNGLRLIIVPNMVSTSASLVTLNVNGLGAKKVRMNLDMNTGNAGTTATMAGWLGDDTPVVVTYKSKFDMWYTDMCRTSASTIYGSVPVQNGGTFVNGETTEENIKEARENLNVPRLSTKTVTLLVANWSSKKQTVNVEGVLGDEEKCHVFITHSPTSFIDYRDCGARCIGQGDGTLTFECETVPISDITINIAIFD